MGYVEIEPIGNRKLDICDNCQQQGVYENGKEIKDSYEQVVMWFCVNCARRVLGVKKN
jgi:hypothetical protein